MGDDKTRSALNNVMGALRERSPRVTDEPAEAPRAHPRVRRPEARFGVDDIMELSNDALLELALDLEPTDLVLILGSRGAGELAERLFALLPESVGRPLLAALKAQGRPDDTEAAAALQRAAAILASPDRG